MPPTVAAATMTMSARFAASQSSTGCWRRRSTSSRPAVRSSQPSRTSRRSSAPPTMPRWPATKIRLPASWKGSATAEGALMLLSHAHQIGSHHLPDKVLEAGLVAPAELGPGLGRVAMQIVDLGRAEIARIDRDQDLAALGVDALLLGAGAAPGDLAADLGEGDLDELAHGMGLAGGDDIVLGLVLLQDQPHRLDIV